MSEAPSMATGPARRSPRWMWIALIASVSINLLVFGLMARSAWMHRHGGPIVASATPLGFIRSLPRERREAIRQAGRGQLQAVRPLWQEAREARREVDKALLAEPFDANAFLEAQKHMLDKENSARQGLAQLFATAASKMTVEERKQMLHWRDRQRGPRRDFGPLPPDDPR